MSQLKAFKKPKSEKAPKVKKLFIAGVGAVGGTLLKQVSKIKTTQPVRVLGVCNRKHTLWFERSQQNYSLINLRRGPSKNWDEIIDKLTSYETGTVLFVDTTGGREVSDLYPRLLQKGIHVVTASKLANSQSQAAFDELHYISQAGNTRFLYETNVGAGLPIIQTIEDLLQTGDTIHELTGVLSGTMTFLFSELEKGRSFSDTVIKARTLGYAEPDPRDDLSGEDVARKFLILARKCGLRIEREDLDVESLIPNSLQDADSATFLERLGEADSVWADRITEATEKNQTLRYTGSLKNGKIKIGVEAVSKDSSLGQLAGTNNLLLIKSDRYSDQPLIIQGPGAGKEVTAAGVLADILKI
jgi:aspartokinase/homoserine dehydrogenase 1